MEHVRERCVLLRACWRIHLGPGLVADFAVSAQPPPRGAAPAPPASCACDAKGGAGEEDEENVTYGRTVTIVCDGQVILRGSMPEYLPVPFFESAYLVAMCRWQQRCSKSWRRKSAVKQTADAAMHRETGGQCVCERERELIRKGDSITEV
jgi:hypothetical protein